MEVVSQTVQVQGVRTHYWSAGEHGPIVLLLHGGGVGAALLSWESTLRALSDTHRVYALDWPGYGDSDHPDIPYSTAYYVQFLAAFMDELGIERASLVGNSMGGAIALGFTLQTQPRVEKLVLVDSYGLQALAPFHRLSYFLVRIPFISDITLALMRSRSAIRASLRAIIHDPKAITDDLIDKALADARRPKSGWAFNVYQRDEIRWGGVRTYYMLRLHEITVPTLVVHGVQDQAVPLACARQAHEHIKGSQLYVMEDCGHVPMLERPDEFNNVVAGFLS
jgi:pimeloyl-ACP methyl ester carboxylesterase